MRPAPDRVLSGGVRLVAAFEHSGPARALVHQLKYRGLTAYADVVAMVLEGIIPRLPIVPVPRVWSRQLQYGVDPAVVLAERLARSLRVPVIKSLSAPIHTRRRAGGDHSRPVAPFRMTEVIAGGVVLVDDVVTTGRTLEAAIGLLGAERVALAVCANAAPPVSSLPAPKRGQI
ncbi:MAG TPA: phosphoribosyltransferase family protein [Acidimicrobiia bacterium]